MYVCINIRKSITFIIQYLETTSTNNTINTQQPSHRQELNLSDALSPQVPVLILFENVLFIWEVCPNICDSHRRTLESPFSLSFHYHVGSEARTQIIGFSSKCLCQMNLISLGLRICSFAFHKPWGWQDTVSVNSHIHRREAMGVVSRRVAVAGRCQASKSE